MGSRNVNRIQVIESDLAIATPFGQGMARPMDSVDLELARACDNMLTGDQSVHNVNRVLVHSDLITGGQNLERENVFFAWQFKCFASS